MSDEQREIVPKKIRITPAHSYSTCTICKPNIFKDPPTMRYSKSKGLEFIERKAKA